MQIVIDIPEMAYNLLKSDETIDWLDAENILGSIAEGIVLQKGHGDLIDRDMCLEMKCRDLVDADGVTMYAVPTGNILRIDAVIPTDKEKIE